MSLAQSGGILTFISFPGTSVSTFVKSMTIALLQAGWKLNQRVPGTASGTFTGNRGNGSTFTVGGRTYTWKTTINNAVPNEVLLGGNILASFNNLLAAVNNGSGQGTIYSNATLPNTQVTLSIISSSGTMVDLGVTSIATGPDGNHITSDVGETLGGGYIVSGQSPQLRASDSQQFQVLVYMFDNGTADGVTHNPQAAVQMISAYDPTVVSTVKLLACVAGSSRTYQIVCSQCQFFVSVPGIDAEAQGSVVCGGIPNIIDESCGTETSNIPVNEAWWISADAGLTPAATPRTIIVDQEQVVEASVMSGISNTSDLPGSASPPVTDVNTFENSDGCYNGVVVFGSGSGSDAGHFRMVAMTPPNHWDQVLSAGNHLVGSMLWVGEQTMELEPLMAWANVNNTNPPILRGQLYDAWIITAQVSMDQTGSFDSANWIAFTNRSKFGTLWLQVPSPTPISISQFTASYAN